jgi:hypothetical protein
MITPIQWATSYARNAEKHCMAAIAAAAAGDRETATELASKARRQANHIDTDKDCQGDTTPVMMAIRNTAAVWADLAEEATR